MKNEYGDVEGTHLDPSHHLQMMALRWKYDDCASWLTRSVDSLLAQQSNITGVSEILNGCL